MGIEIAGKDIRLLMVVRDDNGHLAVVAGSNNKLPLPTAGASNGENLRLLVPALEGVVRTLQPERVAIIRADQNSGVDRAKLEALVELVVFDEGKLLHAYAVATVNASVKRGQGVAMLPGVPGYYERAMQCAGCCLEGC